MAANKKTRKKPSPAKKASRQKKKSAKKLARKKAPAHKKSTRRAAPRKSASRKSTAPKSAAKKLKAVASPAASKKSAAPKKRARSSSRREEGVPFLSETPVPRSGRMSGDLQGLSNVETADSESVDELLEEGNAFEAEAVAGVEHGRDSTAEVHTHEVPEDDIPEEYLDKD